MRHNAIYAISNARTGARIIVTDICVQISHLAEAVEDTCADIAQSLITGPTLATRGMVLIKQSS